MVDQHTHSVSQSLETLLRRVYPAGREERMTEDGIERFLSQPASHWWCGTERAPANIEHKHEDDFHIHRLVWSIQS